MARLQSRNVGLQYLNINSHRRDVKLQFDDDSKRSPSLPGVFHNMLMLGKSMPPVHSIEIIGVRRVEISPLGPFGSSRSLC